MLQEDFDKEFLEIFLKYSLEGLPKKVLITDGYSAYPGIIEKICINHQLCIFHIIKNKRTPSFKKNQKTRKKNRNHNKQNTRQQRQNRRIKEI